MSAVTSRSRATHSMSRFSARMAGDDPSISGKPSAETTSVAGRELAQAMLL